MQNRVLKILVMAALYALPAWCLAQTSAHRLGAADSLFRAGLYTQSFELYEAILQNKEYTPAMLLKMAYIQEGLNHTGRGLYYLNLYYLATNDPSALRKMEELASRYHLQGYETSDADWILTRYYNNHAYISTAIVGLCTVLLAVALYRRLKVHTRPVVTVVFLVLALALLFVHLNFSEKFSTGIIADANTYIMDGPSPGANMVNRVSEGHRIRVIGKKDVWLKVKWNEEVAYVRENSVLPVSL